MIPYFRFQSIGLGPVDIQVWGLLVALGLTVPLLMARSEVRRRGGSVEALYDLSLYLLLPALVMSRVFFLLFYGGANDGLGWLSWFAVWRGGLSSFGGYLGAALGLVFFWWRNGKPSLRLQLESLAFSFPLGYGIGRLGCFFIHDHPGIHSISWLAVSFPAGPRLDLGLLLSLSGFILFGIFALLRGLKLGQGGRLFFLPLLLVLYGSVRFGLDFLRAWEGPIVDQRYLQLTPAQYGAVLLVSVGAVLLVRRRQEGLIRLARRS